VYVCVREGELGVHFTILSMGADKSLAFICSTARIIFLEWVKEVRTTKS
jgi:hypothetical protein